MQNFEYKRWPHSQSDKDVHRLKDEHDAGANRETSRSVPGHEGKSKTLGSNRNANHKKDNSQGHKHSTPIDDTSKIGRGDLLTNKIQIHRAVSDGSHPHPHPHSKGMDSTKVLQIRPILKRFL